MKLEVDDVRLIKGGGTNQFYDLAGVPYNPQTERFGGSYTLTTKEGIKYEIDATSGDLNTVTDLNGNTLTYTDAGIRSSNGTEVKFERDAMGRISAVIDPAGNKIKYEYDAKGDLVKVIDRSGNATQFYYEEPTRSHYLTRIEDPLGRDGIRTEYGEDGRLKRMLDVNGAAVELNYDLENSVQTVKDVFGNPTTYVYNNRGNVLTEIDPLGKVTKRGYDENNQVLFETIVTAESGPNGWTTTYSYDADGNKLSETDAKGRTTRYTYGQYGRMLTETDALGNTTTYTYSPNGNLKTTTDAQGNVTKYTHDLKGNMRRLETGNNTIVFDYYRDGNVKTLEDDLGNKGEYEYTPNGNLKKEVLTIQAPDGTEREIVTEWSYDNKGNIETQIQGERRVDYDYDSNGNLISSTSDGQTTTYRYDAKGKLVETIYPDDTPADDSDNPRTITIYDRGGRERATIDQNGNVTHYEYDAVGRLTKTISPDDTAARVEQLIAAIAPERTIATIDWTDVTYPDATPAYVSGSAYTGTEYTQDGRVKAEFDSNGNRTEYKYDAIARQTEVRDDAQNYVTYTYDKTGNQRTETYYAEGTQWSNTYDESGRLIAFRNPNNHITKYKYYEDGQLKAVVDAKQGRTEYQYSEDGQLKSVKNALGQTTIYEYNDPQGRITKIVLPDRSKESTYIYNDSNNSVTVKDFNGDEIKYVYNESKELKRKELLSLGISVSYDYNKTTHTETIISTRGTTIYQYDESGRLLSRKDPEGPYINENGASIEYTYDENRVTLKTDNREIVYDYNEDGTLKSVTTPGGATEYRYDNGRLAKTIFPNDTAEVIIYDDLGRIDIIRTVKIDPHTEAELEVLASYDYKVDATGNREEVVDHTGRKVEYEYDELNRVIEEKVTHPLNASEDGRILTYTYDAVGNLDYKGDTVAGDTDYVYNNLNQLISSTFGGIETVYTYDDNGSLKTRTTGNKTINYHWENDEENRLMGVEIVEGSETTTIEYEYNEQGIRIGKTVNGVETHYLIDALQSYTQVLEEYDPLGNLKAAYTYGEDLISRVEGNEISFYHVDGLGSTRLLTDALGGVIQSYNYDAYGNLIMGDTSQNAYLFAGEQRDIETGLDYLRARYYDPTLGRFISCDAYEGSLSDPMSQHKYQYAHANPVVNIDPSGYSTLTELAAVAATTAILGGLGLTTVGAIGTAINGGSTSDFLSVYDQFFAGMVDALSFGYSTKARELAYKDQNLKHSGVYFNLGRLGGALSSAWIGSFAATFKTLSSAPWWAKTALGYDLAGAGQGVYEVIKDGLTWADTIYFIPILLGLGASFGIQINLGRLAFGKGLRLNPRSNKAVDMTTTAVADIKLGKRDLLFINAAKRKDVDPDGFLDIIAHAAEDEAGELFIDFTEFEPDKYLDVKEFADFIRKQEQFTPGRPIRLLACNLGRGGECSFAQQLARELGVNVRAADKFWAVEESGKHYVTDLIEIYDPRTGKMRWVPRKPANGNWIDFTP